MSNEQTLPLQHDEDEDDDNENENENEKAEHVQKGQGIGRRKINIEFIEDKGRRHITFSKRKAGIMKKVC
jgi:SRF-type transcription factor (DNA-binding and dimerisation domain)